MTTCVFAMCHHLVLTPSQEARRERRRRKRQEAKPEVVQVDSEDSDVLMEIAKLRALKKRRCSDGVKEEPKDSPIRSGSKDLHHTHKNTLKHTCTRTLHSSTHTCTCLFYCSSLPKSKP